MSPTLLKHTLEKEIDTLTKNRFILFEHRDKERAKSAPYRKLCAEIAHMTKRIDILRTRWRQLNEIY